MENREIDVDIPNDIQKTEYFFYDENDEKNKVYQNNSKKINLSKEMIKYDLIIEKGEDDTIIITLNEQNENVITKYQINLYIQNFIELSPYFKLLFKLNEIYCIDKFYSFIKSKFDKSTIQNQNNNSDNNIINIINLKKSKIKIIPDLNKIYIIFDIIYINLKKEEIKLELKKIETIIDKELIYLYKILLRNKYNYLQRLSYLEKKLLKTKLSLDKYSLLLSKCNCYFEHDIQLKMSLLDIGIDTDIFNSPDQYHFIINILSNLFSNNNIALDQLYKASCNGDNINAFHQNCDNIKNTLIIIKTDDKKIFGGFTCAEWDKSNKYKFDDNAFLFSLDNYEIYPILEKYKNEAINCRRNFYAPIFGKDLFIFDGFFSSKLNKTEENYFDYSKSQLINEKYKLSGKKNFTVTEMEVYKINFYEG
jgi:hypothetical protein